MHSVFKDLKRLKIMNLDKIKGLKRFADCSMPSNEQERIHKAEVAAYNQAIDDVVKNCSTPDVVGQSEQLKEEGRKEATEEIRLWLIDMDYEGLAESL